MNIHNFGLSINRNWLPFGGVLPIAFCGFHTTKTHWKHFVFEYTVTSHDRNMIDSTPDLVPWRHTTMTSSTAIHIWSSVDVTQPGHNRKHSIFRSLVTSPIRGPHLVTGCSHQAPCHRTSCTGSRWVWRAGWPAPAGRGPPRGTGATRARSAPRGTNPTAACTSTAPSPLPGDRSGIQWRSVNNYSPKWTWIAVDIYRAASTR